MAAAMRDGAAAANIIGDGGSGGGLMAATIALPRRRTRWD